MKVAVFSTHVLWSPHFETDLEIMEEHLSNQDEVFHVGCQEELSICDLMTSRNLYAEDLEFEKKRRAICHRCVRRRQKSVALLSSSVTPIRFFNNENSHEIEAEYDFTSNAELRDFSIGTFDVGEAVLSSLISHVRDPYLNINKFKKSIRQYTATSARLYRRTLDLLDQENFNLVYVFNGRFAHSRAILRACQERRVDCLVHERGSDIYHYELFPNVTPHNLAYRKQEILDCWQSTPNHAAREEIGSAFYKERLSAIDQSWHSFVKGQRYGKLPADWDPEKRNIAIFNSSEDEFESIGPEWRNPLYANQLAGLMRICADMAGTNDDSFRLYLRMHPNLEGVSNDYLASFNEIRLERVTIIPPGSDISTYSLLRKCEKVLTFGSSAGIEATYWGKPSILAGITFYRELGATYNPDTHEELIQLLRANLAPKSRESALMYGYYMKTFGRPFRHFQAEGIHKGRFKGKTIEKYDRPVTKQILLEVYWALLSAVARLRKSFLTKREELG